MRVAREGDSLFYFSFFFSSVISAARMHARFNNAGSSMRPQQVVSFLTSTDILLSPIPRRFIHRALSGDAHTALCIGCAQASAHLRGRRVFLLFAGCEKRVSWHVRRISHGHPRLAVSRSKAHGFPLRDSRVLQFSPTFFLRISEEINYSRKTFEQFREIT